MEDNKEIIYLMIDLMKRTGNYVYKRILHDEDKKAYHDGMKYCIHVIENYDASLDNILTVMQESQSRSSTFKRGFFSSAKPDQYYLLAHRHAMNIISNLTKRFITGQSDVELRFYKDRGVIINENESVF